MHRREALKILLATAGATRCGRAEPPESYLASGESALKWTRRLVDLGPRPAGSDAQREQQRLIVEALRAAGAELEEDAFTAQTPLGSIEMKNLIGAFPGSSGKVVALSGHYDTYSRPGLHFVGANDGGSSTGLLLAMAERLRGRELKDEVRLVFFDGEESVRQWTADDSLYGSRRVARRWAEQGLGERLKALINLDMIGDSDLNLVFEGNSTPWLRKLIWETARELGYGAAFPFSDPAYIEDDHIPFLKAGFPAVDLIDFYYGPGNRYWHSEQDTVDKLSAASLATVIHVVEETLARL